MVFLIKTMIDEHGNAHAVPKARLVVQEFQQIQGVDYRETYAPVVKFTSIRCLLALVAQTDLELHQMDVRTEFLNGELDEDLPMEIPEGVECEAKTSTVCKLFKSFYGTKQAPRCWNITIDGFLVSELQFDNSNSDPCLYVRVSEDGSMMIIALYVDDLLLAASKLKKIIWMKKMLSSRFSMEDLGEAKMCLGLEVSRNRNQRTVFLSQMVYIKKF